MKLNTLVATLAVTSAMAALASGAPVVAGAAATVGVLGAAITAISNNTESSLTNGTSANGTSTNSAVTGTPLPFGGANSEKVDSFVTAMIESYGKQDLGSESTKSASKNSEHARNRRSTDSEFDKAKGKCEENKWLGCGKKMLFGADGGWGDDDLDDDDGSQEAKDYLTQHGRQISEGIGKKVEDLGKLKDAIEKYIPKTTDAPLTTAEAPTTTEEALTTRPKPKEHEDDHWYDGWFNMKTGKQEERWRNLRECAEVRRPSNGKSGDCEMRNNCKAKVKFSYGGNEKPVDPGEAVDCFKGEVLPGKDGEDDRQSWRAIGNKEGQVKVSRDED